MKIETIILNGKEVRQATWKGHTVKDTTSLDALSKLFAFIRLTSWASTL